jgi:hypothetical protein
VHLQEVVTGAGGWQLKKVEADASAPPRRDQEREKEAGGCLMVRLDALACGARLDELVDCSRQPRQAHAPAGESQGLVAAEVPPERRRAQLHQHSAAELARRQDAQAVAAAAPSVDELVPEDEAAAPVLDDPARGLRVRSCGNGSKHLICRKGDAHGLCKVSMEESVANSAPRANSASMRRASISGLGASAGAAVAVTVRVRDISLLDAKMGGFEIE